MTKPKALQISVGGDLGAVSALLVLPPKARGLLTLAHGAGAGMEHSWLVGLSEALAEENVATLRYQFPYMEQGSKRVDSPKVATATVVAALDAAEKAAKGLPVFVGGKSFGARMTTTAASEARLPGARGIVCFGFPLHPAKKPDVKRAEHLAQLRTPTLFLQGTRDALADLSLLRPLVAQYRKWITMKIIDDADHGFAVRKSSGRTNADVLRELAVATAAFCER